MARKNDRYLDRCRCFRIQTFPAPIGRYFYAVGGNEKATKLSGINTNKVYFLAYTNMGLLAALAGMITIARLMTATAQSGQNYEMDAIASCFIGGASAYGGIGTVPGVIIGATLMGVINLGMNTMSDLSDPVKRSCFKGKPGGCLD